MRAPTTLLLGAILIATIGGAGCASSDRATAPPTSATTTTTTVVDGPELIESGSAPLVSLRLKLTKGSKQDLVVTTDVGVSEDGPAGPQTVDPPPVVQTIRLRVGAVAADGTARVSFEVIDATVGRGNALTPAEDLTYTAALAGLRGIGGSGRLSPQGHLDAVELSLPTDVGPSVRAQVASLRSQITRLTPSLPNEPVGVGGSWSSESTTSLGGATVTQSVTTTITAITGDQVSYRSTTRSTAARQPLPAVGLPTGTTATLASSELNGTGTGTLDLATLASTSSTTASGTQVIEFQPADGPSTSSAQRLAVATRSESKR